MTVNLYRRRYVSTTSSHQDKLVKFLIKELGGKEQVKRFSSELKGIGIDLSMSKTQEFVMTPEGSPLLFTLVSYFNFGILNKLDKIKTTITKGN